MSMQVGWEERGGTGRKRQRKGKAETRTMSKPSDWNRTKMGAGWNRGWGQRREAESGKVTSKEEQIQKKTFNRR